MSSFVMNAKNKKTGEDEQMRAAVLHVHRQNIRHSDKDFHHIVLTENRETNIQGEYLGCIALQSPPQPEIDAESMVLQKIGFTCERTKERHTFDSMADFIAAFLTVKRERDERRAENGSVAQPVDRSDVVERVESSLLDKLGYVPDDADWNWNDVANVTIAAMRPFAGLGEDVK